MEWYWTVSDCGVVMQEYNLVTLAVVCMVRNLHRVIRIPLVHFRVGRNWVRECMSDWVVHVLV